jgi:hypothetical protein
MIDRQGRSPTEDKRKKSPATAEGRDIETEQANRVKMTIGNENNEPRDQGTGPWEHRQRHGDHPCELQEWKCHCGHHTGSEQDTGSATVAIRDNYKEMSTVSADHRRTTDRAIEAIGTNETEKS